MASSLLNPAARAQAAWDVTAVRRDFPALEQTVHGHPLVYLDNAATTQKPRPVLEKMLAFYQQDCGNIHRSIHQLGERATEAYEKARLRTQAFLGAGSAHEIVFVRGATEAINLVAQTFGRQRVGAGDRVLITELEHHSNIVPWQMLCEEKGAHLDVAPIDDAGELIWEEFIARLTPRTRMILLNSPSNPSGAVFSRELFQAALELCRERGIWLLSDECSLQFVYDGAPYSVAGEPGPLDNLIIAGSLSKTYAMTGWRLGYALGPKAVIAAMLNLQSHSTSNPVSFVQKAAVAALTGSQQPVTDMLAEYRRRRTLMIEGLRSIPGISCTLPQGAFYAYPNIARLLRPGAATPMEFSGRLLHEAGVVTVPGEAFGTASHLRLSYATSAAQIEKGLDRLRRFCAGL